MKHVFAPRPWLQHIPESEIHRQAKQLRHSVPSVGQRIVPDQLASASGLLEAVQNSWQHIRKRLGWHRFSTESKLHGARRGSLQHGNERRHPCPPPAEIELREA